MSPTVCNSNGGTGCVRGFVREKCGRCHLGSIACEMCHSSRTHNAHHHSGRLSLHHTLWSSSSSLPAPKSTSLSMPCSPTALRLPYDAPLVAGSDTLAVSSWNTSTAQPTAGNCTKVAAISYKEPLPVGHHPNQPHGAASAASTVIPRRPSLSVKTHSATQHALAKPSSKSEPSSPIFSSRPITPISCGFCTGGRKACDECFGLGYVQRVCQSCLRDQHRRHARKPSLPASIHQLGTKIKERFSHHSSSSTALNSVVSLQRRSSSTSASDSTYSSRSSTSGQGFKQLQAQPQQQNQQDQNPTSTVSLPSKPTALSTNSFTNPQPNSPTLELVDETFHRQQAGEVDKGVKRTSRQHRLSSTPCGTDDKQIHVVSLAAGHPSRQPFSTYSDYSQVCCVDAAAAVPMATVAIIR